MKSSLSDWDAFLANYPDAHLLQTAEWGELKSAFGWKVERVVFSEIGVQILFHHLPLGFTFAYIPKGPVLASSSFLPSSMLTGFWSAVDRICRSHRAIFLKIEPDAWETDRCLLFIDHFIPSPHSVQPRHTIVVDMRGSEEEILARMKQKARYNIRLAERKSVIVQPWNDLEAFHAMILVTGERDVFGVHNVEYYRRAYDLFHPTGMCELFVARYEGRPIAALMAFARGKRAWYFYGASTDEERNRMPTYLLQWEAMRWAKGRGCEMYDLWGVPDEDETALEAHFTERSDGLWGVYRFKRGFGGEMRWAAETLDRVYNPWLYRLFLWKFSRMSNK
jgi:lipid II:glycine glycyltransferase (peptidoglycan interpeptide bridge formation enzyme)